MVGDTEATANAGARDRESAHSDDCYLYSPVFRPGRTWLAAGISGCRPVPGAVSNSAADRGRFSHGSYEQRMRPCGAITLTERPVLYDWEVDAYVAQLRQEILDTHNVINLTAGVHAAEVAPPGLAEAAHLRGILKAVDSPRWPDNAHYSELSGLLRTGEARKMYIVSGVFVAAGIAVSLFRGLSAGLPFLVAGATVGVALLPGFVALAWARARSGARRRG